MIWTGMILALVLAGWALRRAEQNARILQRLEAQVHALTPPPADSEKARRAREAIERFNEGIAGILGFDAGGRGGEGL